MVNHKAFMDLGLRGFYDSLHYLSAVSLRISVFQRAMIPKEVLSTHCLFLDARR